MGLGREFRRLDFYHIPKTGGRFFEANVLNILKYDFIKRNIPIEDKFYKYKDHKSFKFIEENPFGISLLRNPVDRTVSHYLYVTPDIKKITGDLKKDKYNFFEYLEKDNCSLHNFQSKYICNQKFEYNVADENVKDIVADIILSKDRIKKVDILIKTETLDMSMCKTVLGKIYNHFNMDYNTEFQKTVLDAKSFKNEKSNEMRQSLTKSEISIIEGYMGIDMEIYETSEFFTPDKDTADNG